MLEGCETLESPKHAPLVLIWRHRWFRTARPCPKRQVCCAGSGKLEKGRLGEQGRAQEPHPCRGGVYSPRKTRPEPAMRLCVHIGGQPADRGRPGGQIAPRRGDGARSLGRGRRCHVFESEREVRLT